ncbi:MAG TPA: isocitrate lyase/phosphoenolpyruvate mutase family protein, partial [Rhizobiales bacterium]|nr:isocitrate lyase/phosphoenolpyruvate mutase family protein [Hyphomicrobiales bacterium]
MDQKEKAKLFRAMHGGDRLLVLPNCWDVVSARTLRHAGAKAIATASASISWARGVPDGEGLGLAEMLEVVALVCANVDIPVSADMERGYGETAEDVEASIAAVIAAGAIGVNIEDNVAGGGQRPVSDMQTRLAAARRAGDRAGVDIYINARADGYLLGGTGDEVFHDTVLRGKAWLEAGADCVFIPGIADIEVIKQLVVEIGGPVSVIVMDENTPSLGQLTKSGVVRISTGPRPMQAVMGC